MAVGEEHCEPSYSATTRMRCAGEVDNAQREEAPWTAQSVIKSHLDRRGHSLLRPRGWLRGDVDSSVRLWQWRWMEHLGYWRLRVGKESVKLPN